MNKTMETAAQETPSKLMGTLAIMGFAAENNLRDVAQALGRRDLRGLSKVAEKNAKQSRLRIEIEEQIAGEMAHPAGSAHARRKLVLVSQVALMFERMGAHTVEISAHCAQIILEPRPSRVAEIKKLIEHAVYIADRAATGLIEEDEDIAKIAVEQKRAATDLNTRINRDLASLTEAGGNAATRAELLCRIAGTSYRIIEEAGQLAQDVLVFLAPYKTNYRIKEFDFKAV